VTGRFLIAAALLAALAWGLFALARRAERFRRSGAAVTYATLGAWACSGVFSCILAAAYLAGER
jgi:hypothetical protein